MIINIDPDDYVTEISHSTCPFHKKHPGEPYAGCSCSSSYIRRRATPEERRTNKIQRLTKELPSLRSTLKAKERELETAQRKAGDV